jgi:hypothetical protein
LNVYSKNRRFETEIKPDISCQSIKLENFHLRFIYRISYKIAKKANPPKWICPIENCRYAIKAKMSDISAVSVAANNLGIVKDI